MWAAQSLLFIGLMLSCAICISQSTSSTYQLNLDEISKLKAELRAAELALQKLQDHSNIRENNLGEKDHFVFKNIYEEEDIFDVWIDDDRDVETRASDRKLSGGSSDQENVPIESGEHPPHETDLHGCVKV